MFILLLIIFVVVVAFVGVKVNNLKTRAKNHILKNTGLSDSEISATAYGALGKRYLGKIVADHPSFTEDSVKETAIGFAQDIMNKNSNPAFSDKVVEKMGRGNEKLEKMKSMEFSRVDVPMYMNNMFSALVIYNDKKDEYMINMQCKFNGEEIKVNSFDVSKGSSIGF